jgi:glyoxylase-like metal-dependent hydrolase (beta-lactamase superfamily II)
MGHLITHAHSDHQGSSFAIHQALGVPVLAGHLDADALESGDLKDRSPGSAVSVFQRRYWAGPAVPVARRLQEGDAVGSYTVLEAPGHAPGLIALWREADRTLIAADVMFGRHPVTGKPGLHEPPARFTLDPALNRVSIRRFAELRPSVVCFGHGQPWRDTDALSRFADGLPD